MDDENERVGESDSDHRSERLPSSDWPAKGAQLGSWAGDRKEGQKSPRGYGTLCDPEIGACVATAGSRERTTPLT